MTELTREPFKPETWPTDADGFPADLCTDCGTPVRYGSRHGHCLTPRPVASTDSSPAERPGDLLAWGSQAVLDVAAERRRQIEAEGWSPEHDDQSYPNGELADAAACYALPGASLPSGMDILLDAWPFPRAWYKPGDRRRELVKAGALILAEIERLDRAA